MDDTKKKDIILLIIKNDEILNFIYSSLNNRFVYITASTSIEAFSKMTFNIPSLIIADIDIKSINVLKFLKTVRNGIKTKLIPFMIISSTNNHIQRIKAIEQGVDSFLVYPSLAEEFNAIVHSMLSKFKEFYLLTITDELTRLYNRKEFIKKFNDEITETKHKVISLAIMDIDHFKNINDIYGHQTGDIVLMKLANTLNKNISKKFFPARFGGEEFVVLFPDLKINDATQIMKSILKEFSSIEFEVNKRTFFVTFSVGISEYPTMGRNISELLSRADQALYAAKNDGRNLVYTFNPIMARNDKFWEFLKIKKNIFVHEGIFEPITKQPFLPQLLEIISNLDYEVQNIGILILSISNSFNIESNIVYKNLTYDIENIQRIIIRSTELVFPTDAFFGISDIYRYEFIILFPSVSDFKFNLVKFKEICKDISMTINENLKNFPYDFSYASDVATLNINNPRKILSDIDRIRQNKICISDKSVSYSSYKKSIKSISKLNNLKNMIKLKNCYDTTRMQVSYQYFSLKKPFEYMNVFNLTIQDQIDSLKKLKDFLSLSQNTFHNKISAPLLFPYLPKIDFSHFIRTLSRVYVEENIIIMIDENSLIHTSCEALLSCISSLPPNFSIGIDNCFISNEILNILSQFNFSILAFSESIIRNLYMFKNRMKVISGLIIFLDQIMVPSLTFNIQSEAEFQIINDLRIKFCSGKYPDYIKQHVKK